MNCEYCGKDAVYRCSICGRLICGEHAKLRTVCTSCIKKTILNCTIDKVTLDKERKNSGDCSTFLGERKSNTRISCARESLTFIVLTHLLFVDRILQVHNASYRKTLYEPRC